MNDQIRNIKISFFFRKPLPFHKSIEQVFGDVIRHLPSRFLPQKVVMHNYSNGLWNRLKIIFQSMKSQGEINHVTGDIHFANLFMQKNKTILTIHDCRLLDELHGIKYILFKWLWFSLPVMRSRYVTVVSSFTLSRLKHHLHLDDSKIKIIPVAVDEKFKPVPKEFNNQKPVVLQVGTVVNKNLHRVAEALQGINCHLRIIGDLTEEDRFILNNFHPDYSNVSDLSIEDVINEYIQSDMLLFASTYEGFGMPIIEAQTIGRPVITSSLASMPEIAGDAAFLVDPFDVVSIRNAVLRIIQDPLYRSGLIQKGFVNIQRYQMPHVMNLYTQLYDTIAAEN